MTHKYIAYGFGLLLGCLVMAQVYSSKLAQRDAMMQRLNEVKKPYARMLPGEDFNAQRPLNINQAAEVKEGERDAGGVFRRTIIFDGEGERPSLRFEEILWYDQLGDRVYLLKRQHMLADELVVRLRKNVRETELRELLHGTGLVFQVKDAKRRLYKIKLPELGIKQLEKSEQWLARYSKIIAGFTRVYYIDAFDSV